MFDSACEGTKSFDKSKLCFRGQGKIENLEFHNIDEVLMIYPKHTDTYKGQVKEGVIWCLVSILELLIFLGSEGA